MGNGRVGAGDSFTIGTTGGLRAIRLKGFVQPEQGHTDEGSEQVMARMSCSYRFHDDLRHFSQRSGHEALPWEQVWNLWPSCQIETLDRNARTRRQPGR